MMAEYEEGGSVQPFSESFIKSSLFFVAEEDDYAWKLR